MELKYIKSNNDKYNTIKQVLKEEFKISSRLIIKLKKLQLILLNNTFTYLDYHLNIGDIITVNLDFDEDNFNIIATEMSLDILYEDEYLLVVNKPAGIPVHPSSYHPNDTLANGIKYYYNKINLNKLIRPINRLDCNTSGIVMFAKNEYIQECLVKQMAIGKFKKNYIALCCGHFTNKEGIINVPIARKKDSIIERCVDLKYGEYSLTKYRVENEFTNPTDFSELIITLETGRTHQIRVHMAYIGHPILGDDLYGKKSNLIYRQALHAYKVSLIHPVLKRQIIITADIPDDIKNLIK